MSKTITLYIAVSPAGAMVAATAADQADRAWRKLCDQVSDAETLHERGWRVGQLRCELVDIAE